MLIKLPKVKNDLDRMEKMTTMNTNTRIMPSWEIRALSLSFKEAEVFSLTGGILE
jgi:hypothetical protein